MNWLSRVAQLRGSDPSHRCSAHLESDHFAHGIGDHLALGVDPILTLEISKLSEIVCVYTTLCRESGIDESDLSSCTTLSP